MDGCWCRVLTSRDSKASGRVNLCRACQSSRVGWPGQVSSGPAVSGRMAQEAEDRVWDASFTVNCAAGALMNYVGYIAYSLQIQYIPLTYAPVLLHTYVLRTSIVLESGCPPTGGLRVQARAGGPAAEKRAATFRYMGCRLRVDPARHQLPSAKSMCPGTYVSTCLNA